jgi:hypothetical protein
MEGCATQEEMNGNVLATMKRGYTPINSYLDAYRGTLSICGAGPSLQNSIKELTGDVMACNSALLALLNHGIVPKFAMMWDAHELVANFAIPHPDVLYLVGARCHPKVFDRLKDCKVVCWHAGGDHNIKEFMEEHSIVEPMINGGSAAVTRSLYLGFALGYRTFHVHGGDSSYSDDGKTHIYGSVVPEKDMEVWIGNSDGKKKFRTTPEWCAQVEEYKAILPYFNHLGATIEAHGEGMLPHVHRKMVESYERKDNAGQ